MLSVRSNSLAETVSMVWDSANTDSSGIFEPKVKAHSEEDYEPSSRRPPQTTLRKCYRGAEYDNEFLEIITIVQPT